MSMIANGRSSGARVVASLLGLAFAECFSISATIIPPGGLTATLSGNNLVLSFQTTTTNYYGLQMCPDLSQPWTNIQAGLQGYGLVKMVTLSNALAAGQGFYRTVIQPKPMKLLLPVSDAFAILGYDCGGITEQVYAIGFDPTNGYPTAYVGLKTVCSCGKDCSTTHTKTATVTWDLSGNVISTTVPATETANNPSFIATDGFNDIFYNSGANAYLIVPIPEAPTDVTAGQIDDQFQVSWIPHALIPATIISSTLTATPVDNPSASNLTATVSGAVTNGIITTLQPATTYQITVESTTIGGSSPASVPISVVTSPATIPPSASTNVVVQWASPGADPGPNTIVTTWKAVNPGNSPVDVYLVTATGSEGAGTFTNSVPGTTLSSDITADSNYNWSVTVQAHNAAGWGPVSAVAHLGGL
jgi:hypothetical protein